MHLETRTKLGSFPTIWTHSSSLSLTQTLTLKREGTPGRHEPLTKPQGGVAKIWAFIGFGGKMKKKEKRGKERGKWKREGEREEEEERKEKGEEGRQKGKGENMKGREKTTQKKTVFKLTFLGHQNDALYY